MPEPILAFDNCTMRFGGVVAVSDVSLQLEENDLIGLIGPNGAGKTTVFNMITGVYQPTKGDVRLGGRSIVGLKPHQIARLAAVPMGIALVWLGYSLWSERREKAIASEPLPGRGSPQLRPTGGK